MPGARVLLVDDHPLMRAGIRKVLESQPSIAVVGEASNGEEALRALEAIEADVLLLDLSMPGLDGFEVLRRARAIAPSVRILVLTMHSDAEYVARAIHLGADGYLLKDSAAQDLVAAIEAVLAGRVFYSPEVQRQLSDLLRVRSGTGPLQRLTDRERAVLALIAAGLSTREIGARLGIGIRTVETHRANLMRKLGLRSVALLTQFAIREGLVQTP
jgi:NarL family two-component system response regulator LiaR